jgi:hypothetical protein
MGMSWALGGKNFKEVVRGVAIVNLGLIVASFIHCNIYWTYEEAAMTERRATQQERILTSQDAAASGPLSISNLCFLEERVTSHTVSDIYARKRGRKERIKAFKIYY